MIGLPSLEALDQAQGSRIWMAAEATDMRCGFDRLAERVKRGNRPGSAEWSLVFVLVAAGDRMTIFDLVLSVCTQ